jgi:predicted TPR repeat methyltransferase
LGDHDSAIYHFNQALQYDPHRVGALINLGAVYNQMGRPEQALQVLRQAIKIDSRRAEIYYNLGLAHRRLGQAELANQAYREAIHLNPKLVDAHYNLGNLLQELGRLSQALVCYKEALRIDPGFHPAKIGRHQVEQLLQNEPTATTGSSAKMIAPQVNAAVDMHQPLDPRFDAPLLQALHRTTVTSEGTCRDLIRILAEELEPAIKGLSSALLYSNSSATELSEHLERFEKAINRTRLLQKNWQTTMQRINELNEKLMQPLAAAAAGKARANATSV